MKPSIITSVILAALLNLYGTIEASASVDAQCAFFTNPAPGNHPTVQYFLGPRAIGTLATVNQYQFVQFPNQPNYMYGELILDVRGFISFMYFHSPGSTGLWRVQGDGLYERGPALFADDCDRTYEVPTQA